MLLPEDAARDAGAGRGPQAEEEARGGLGQKGQAPRDCSLEPSVLGRAALHPAWALISHGQGNARKGAGLASAAPPTATGDADPCP